MTVGFYYDIPLTTFYRKNIYIFTIILCDRVNDALILKI